MSTADPLTNKNLQSNLQWSLLFLRLGVFIVMFVWTLDKFVNPAHSIKIFEHFYKISGFNDIIAYCLGALQLILVIAFLFGIKKRLSYGLIFLMHAGSTLSAYALYIDAFNNLLFFAAWPMLAACAALYLLRDADTKFTLGK
ncbi:DoxX family membrane protein [Colwellia sp. C1TZA3]|uniref:DoxX family membrane protein n=1 Tax=Colwellia sp. C1TZA3 TaxID=2508879 RepID=UPI0011BA477F|nr:DoxX family membrane protein [Colwellia sp. C1TZA3]TWX73990.1 DoxX family membrane protein [Colwellia sp. C1TZA3]